MNPILISPQITSDKPIAEQLQQMKSYLFRFKEEVELLLSNIDSDNLSEKFEDDFSKIVGSKIMGSNEMSQIIQSAGRIKLSVEALDSSVASLTLTTNGIYNQINDPDNGILTELSIVSGQVAAAVKFGVNYSGFNISSNKIHLFTTGALQIDSGNFQVDTDGNVTIVGNITANSGTFNGTINASGGSIGTLGINAYGLTCLGKSILYQSGQNLFFGDYIDESVETWIWGKQVRLNAGAGYFAIGSDGNCGMSGSLDVPDIKAPTGSNMSKTTKSISWQKLDDVLSTDYVLVGDF